MGEREVARAGEPVAKGGMIVCPEGKSKYRAQERQPPKVREILLGAIPDTAFLQYFAEHRRKVYGQIL